jgi:peptide chain release factor 1
MWNKLDQIESRYQEIEERLADPALATDLKELQRLAQEKAGIDDVVSTYRDHRATAETLEETRSMLGQEQDEEMAELVRQEIAGLEAKLEDLEQRIRSALVPKDPNDDKNIIMEVRAGAGGDEAGLFAADLFRMYTRYAQARRWEVEVLNTSESGIGGFKEVTFEVRGKGAFSKLKYERGVHRVQRVPVTESSGRIHTSTATVAVLPEAEEVDVDVNPDDLRIDIFHSGGAGGQNVNKVATAVRITHTPTGMVVVCQDERSQLRNKNKAMTVLRARLLDIERSRQEAETSSQRRSQVGTGDRSEKIRTYNFPQDRLSDHRIGLNLHNISRIMEGDLDQLIDALTTEDRAQQLQEQLV